MVTYCLRNVDDIGIVGNILSSRIKLRIFVTAEPDENSVEMKRALEDYLRSMRISSEVSYAYMIFKNDAFKWACDWLTII